MELTTEHEELKRSALRFVEEEINPHVDEWEENEIFPAHDLFKKLGKIGDIINVSSRITSVSLKKTKRIK